MKDVTAEFGKYDLKEINQEYLNNASGAEKEYVLPKTVGGSKVHLLLGIKNTKIQPVLIKVLPSGVSVYLSPFKDVQGSRIIYAGPSKCFTRMDDDQNRELNHAIYTVSCVDIMGGSCNTINFSKSEPEITDFSEPEPQLELIDFRDFSNP